MLKCLIGGVKYGVEVGSDFKTVVLTGVTLWWW